MIDRGGKFSPPLFSLLSISKKAKENYFSSYFVFIFLEAFDVSKLIFKFYDDRKK